MESELAVSRQSQCNGEAPWAVGRRLGLLALVALVAAPLAADPAPSLDPPRFPSETSAVVVDVVVRDKHGRVVRDLATTDFRVFEDGVEQTIDGFVVIALGGERPDDAGASSVAAAPTARPATGTAAVTPAATAGQRLRDIEVLEAQPALVTIVFDRLSPTGRDFARKSALSFAENVRHTGDVVGIFTMDLALHAAELYTTDHDRIVAGIRRATDMVQTGSDWREARAKVRDRQDSLIATDAQLQKAIAGGATGRGNSIGLFAGRRQMEEMAIRLEQTTETLEREQNGYASTRALTALIKGLGKIRGRKTLLLFSEGLAIPAAVLREFRGVIDAANKANVSVYAVDAAGLRAQSDQEEARQEMLRLIAQREQEVVGSADPFGSLLARMERAEDRMRLAPAATLEPLARETGGLFVADDNDVSQRLQQMGEDMRFYYVLSYTAKNQHYDGRFRKLSVKVRRKGLDVRTRRGYLAIQPEGYERSSSLR